MEPSQPETVSSDDPEVREVLAMDASEMQDVLDAFCRRFSDLQKVWRSIAWWQRYIRILQHIQPCDQRQLTVHEIGAAENLALQSAQRRHFKAEYIRLSQGESVRANSRLAALGSRLRFAKEASTPTILPHDDVLTGLIIRDAHEKDGHVGTEQVLASLRTRYWIL